MKVAYRVHKIKDYKSCYVKNISGFYGGADGDGEGND